MRLSVRVALITLVFSIAAAGGLHARTLRYEKERFTIAVPDHRWSADTVPEYDDNDGDRLLRVIAADSSITLAVQYFPDPRGEAVLDDKFVATQFDEYRSNGMIIHDTSYTTLGGVRGISFSLTKTLDGDMKLYCYIVLTIANRAAYQIVVHSTARLPESDPDVRRMIQSFAFIGSPELPTGPGLASPPPEELGGASQKRVEWMAMGGCSSRWRLSSSVSVSGAPWCAAAIVLATGRPGRNERQASGVVIVARSVVVHKE